MRTHLEMMNRRNHSSQTIRVIILDEKEIIRTGLRTILEGASGFQVVSEASTLHDIRRQSSRNVFDILIWGISSELSEFLQEYAEVSSRFPNVKVMLVLPQKDEKTFHTISRMPRVSCLVQNVGSEELIIRLRELTLPQDFNNHKPSAFSFEKVQEVSHLGNEVKTGCLSIRERELVALIAQGKTNREIADAINVAEKTVKNYVSNIFDKLNVTRRTQVAAIYAAGKIP